MRTVKLVIGFQGTAYEGWQSQKKGRSIQEVIEKALKLIFKTRVDLTGSSRTDAGVHAEALVAHFRTQSKLSDDKIKDALNFNLPRDILIRSAETVPGSFHARYGAKSKIYAYRIWNSRTRPLFEAPFVLWHPFELELSLMKKAARALVGRRDFRAFQDNGGDERRSTVRRVRRIAIVRKKELVTITIEADGFLRHMIRVIVGTLLEAGRGRLGPGDIARILRSKDRRKAGTTAKPQGLTLLKVNY